MCSKIYGKVCYKKEYLVNVKQFKIHIINEPDAKTQS
ncbi:MAG: cysteine-rich KTR domain-containing protein [Agathobacter rectalis]